MFEKTRIEVLSIGAHLVIACIVIIGWVVLRLFNITDSTFNMLLVVVVTYFFGVVNTGMVSSLVKARQPDNTPPAPVDNSTNYNTYTAPIIQKPVDPGTGVNPSQYTGTTTSPTGTPIKPPGGGTGI